MKTKFILIFLTILLAGCYNSLSIEETRQGELYCKENGLEVRHKTLTTPPYKYKRVLKVLCVDDYGNIFEKD